MGALDIVLKPRMSEKAYGVSQLRNTYVFDVDGDTNKHTIARAVSEQYGVTVTAVNVVNQKGKTKRTVRKGGRPTMGRQSDVKKAYVTLKSGDTLPVFAAVEAAEAKEAKINEQVEKAATKAEAKETKKNPLARIKKAKKEEEK